MQNRKYVFRKDLALHRHLKNVKRASRTESEGRQRLENASRYKVDTAVSLHSPITYRTWLRSLRGCNAHSLKIFGCYKGWPETSLSEVHSIFVQMCASCNEIISFSSIQSAYKTEHTHLGDHYIQPCQADMPLILKQMTFET